MPVKIKFCIRHKLKYFFNSKIGQAVWSVFCAIVSIEFVQKLFRRALFIDNKKIDGCVVLPKIDDLVDQTIESVLIVMPFYSINASTSYCNQIAQYLKNKEYRIIGVVYGDSQIAPDKNIYDEFYQVVPQHPKYSFIQGNPNDINEIDEWIGSEIIQFTAALKTLRKIDIVIINYVFLTKLFEKFTAPTFKVLLTHDVFAFRNKKIKAAGLTSNCFYFSTDYENEKMGLSRSDVVFSIQSEEKNFFHKYYGLLNIEVLPFIPPKNYLPLRLSDNENCCIGYIGSSHHPNVDAILDFINKFDFSCVSNLFIAGTVCESIIHLNFPSKVKLLGKTKDLQGFYNDCDIIINPDKLESGLKIKTVEAFSYGKPLICTRVASIGIDVTSKYHKALTITECIAYVREVSLDSLLREKLAIESKIVFDRFCSEYSISRIMDKHTASVRES